jgi:hypothetical protein
MSTVYDVIKPAIVTAVQAIDATMRVYDYVVNPSDTSPVNLFQLFGVLTGSPPVVPSDPNLRRINFASITRRRPGRFEDIRAIGPRDEVRYGNSDWQIDLWASVQDPTVSPTISTPSEYFFQEKLDQLARELFLNDAIISLIGRPGYNITVQSVDIGDTWFVLLGNEIWCHQTSVTLTAKHLMNTGTF